ncbi:uncharacterized protein C8Q71DRAFT_381736 [Rhodofomes roseus]|uniref:Protein kinase domain-containing protein n=1 Tax=Rhodofomes roseus TaxID=34475 RepID=A0ABQ8K0S2_9APHY|nr:uncharacterized protein C8Q71DRAFT_381736 [Rhodofomes roseus]KAH9830192.1 hypothetical protein C8Q71DRAFT_381736 [Rhodofomes roseus]
MYMWGLDPHHQRWMLVKPAPGTRLDKTAAYRRVQHSPQHCWALVNHAIDLATASILSTYESSHYLHQDPVLGNVLFDDNVSRAHLIDWGCATTDSRQATPADVKGLVSHFFQNSRGVQLCGGGPPPQVVHIPVMHAPANHCPMPVYHLGHALPGWH